MKSTQKYGAWLAGAIFSVVPAVVFAAVTDIKSVFVLFVTILNEAVIPLIIGLAFVVFLWGVYKYVTTASLDGKAGAKETIIYGLIGLFVMLAAWGLVNILITTFFGTGLIYAPPWQPSVPTP